MEGPQALLDSCRTCARGHAFDLFGVVDAAAFDRCQPQGRRACDLVEGAGTVVVLGHGGPDFWRHIEHVAGPIGRARPGYDPIDAFSRQSAEDLVAILRRAGQVAATVLPSDKRALNFLQLGEEAGFGTISPAIGLLIHPRYGPWISLRAAVVIAGRPFGEAAFSRSIAGDYQPCAACRRPCLTACPSGAYRPDQTAPQIERCADYRHQGGCAHGCDVRRACPVGSEYRYEPKEERFRHAYSLFTMQRVLGLGAWRYVPRFFRGI
jgi:epoxyqueuosine reductase QueG